MDIMTEILEQKLGTKNNYFIKKSCKLAEIIGEKMNLPTDYEPMVAKAIYTLKFYQFIESDKLKRVKTSSTMPKLIDEAFTSSITEYMAKKHKLVYNCHNLAIEKDGQTHYTRIQTYFNSDLHFAYKTKIYSMEKSGNDEINMIISKANDYQSQYLRFDLKLNVDENNNVKKSSLYTKEETTAFNTITDSCTQLISKDHEEFVKRSFDQIDRRFEQIKLVREKELGM